MRLLLIEDDEGIADLLQLSLTALGHEVSCAADGSSGLDTATRTSRKRSSWTS